MLNNEKKRKRSSIEPINDNSSMDDTEERVRKMSRVNVSSPSKRVLSPNKAITSSTTDKDLHSSTAQKYNYVQLADFNGTMKNINLYGVIVDYTSPKISNYNYYILTIYITDPSLKSNHLPVIIRRDLHQMPKLKRIGQLIRLHRVDGTFWNNETQITTTQKSSITVFDASKDIVDQNSLELFKQISPNSTWEYQDIDYINRLSAFSNSTFIEFTYFHNKYVKKLKDLNVNNYKYTDIIAQIVAIEERSDELIAKVWDGTNYFDQVYADIIVNNTIIADYIRNIKLNTWVKFRNLGFSANRGLFTHQYSHISILPLNHKAVKDILSEYSQQQAQIQTQQISSTNLNPIDYEKTPLNSNSLENLVISEHPNTNIEVTPISKLLTIDDNPAKFRIRGRIIGFEPPSYEYFCQPFCPYCKSNLSYGFVCSKCEKFIDRDDRNWEFRYKILFQCEKSKSEIKILVEKEDANKFLHIKPQCFYSYEVSNSSNQLQNNPTSTEIIEQSRDNIANIIKQGLTSIQNNQDILIKIQNQNKIEMLRELEKKEKRDYLFKILQFLQNPNHILDMCVVKYKSRTGKIIYRLSETSLKPINFNN